MNIVPDRDRFWGRLDKSGSNHGSLGTPCWTWTGSRLPRGYGRLRVAGGYDYSHRVAWLVANGPIPAETPCVLHKCDNPPCCNPAHLFLGTKGDNARDRETKGRGIRGRRLLGTTRPNRKIDAAGVVAVREARASGATTRDIVAKFGISQTLANCIVRGAVGGAL